jgi:large subunit ribosomal protein L6
MSRLGKLPITIPEGVKVALKDDFILVEGPKGKLNFKAHPEVNVNVAKDEVTVVPVEATKSANSYQGLYRQLVMNMVEGVTKGFSKTLIINGVGYRADLKGDILTLNLGYSQVIDVVVPTGITITVETPTKVIISGIDKQLVGQTAAEIRALRKPEPYKGKGIRYEDEMIRRKAGKSAAAKG